MESHVEAITYTEMKKMTAKCRNDYRNRINTYIQFLRDTYPGMYERSVRSLTEEERLDPKANHHKNMYDLVYTGFNPSFFCAFLTHKSIRSTSADGKNIIASHAHLRKYDDAVKWGSSVSGQALPRTYYEKVDAFLKAYRKQFAAAKKEGQVDEKEADAISSSLFRLICQWAIDDGNVKLWTFGLMQWNLMARSSNIDGLAFHNIRRGVSDSISISFDYTKADQVGENITEKNVYANPFQPQFCPWLALAIYIASKVDQFEQTEKLFVTPGKRSGSASSVYCRQLGELLKKHELEAQRYIRIDHANAHGIRKVRFLFFVHLHILLVTNFTFIPF